MHCEQRRLGLNKRSDGLQSRPRIAVAGRAASRRYLWYPRKSPPAAPSRHVWVHPPCSKPVPISSASSLHSPAEPSLARVPPILWMGARKRPPSRWHDGYGWDFAPAPSLPSRRRPVATVPVETGKRAHDKIVVRRPTPLPARPCPSPARLGAGRSSPFRLGVPDRRGHGHRRSDHRPLGRRHARSRSPDADRRELRLVHDHSNRDPLRRIPTPAATHGTWWFGSKMSGDSGFTPPHG